MEADLITHIAEVDPAVLIVDSVQTISTDAIEGIAGGVAQVRTVTAVLTQSAKAQGRAMVLVGHVTKEGTLAGPRMLEHMVDTVLYFEGDRNHIFRILRAVKNRFGSTNEIGVFEMKDAGLKEVPNPSELFLAERPEDASGSVVVPAIEGTRPILVEIQALVSGAAYGNPQRKAMGIDANRIALLVAVLEKKVGYAMLAQDVFVNVAGGVRLAEPAVDLGVVAALASSHLNRPLGKRTVLFGEIGLAGEVRAVSHPELRVKEAARLGFNRCLLPYGNLKNLDKPRGIQLVGVRSATEALEDLFQ